MRAVRVDVTASQITPNAKEMTTSVIGMVMASPMVIRNKFWSSNGGRIDAAQIGQKTFER
jgi:hypothetical protein